MTEAICEAHALEGEARIEETPGVLDLVPLKVRETLRAALAGMVEEIRGLGPQSCLRQALAQSDLRLDLGGWMFRLRTRDKALQIVAATPK